MKLQGHWQRTPSSGPGGAECHVIAWSLVRTHRPPLSGPPLAAWEPEQLALEGRKGQLLLSFFPFIPGNGPGQLRVGGSRSRDVNGRSY